MVDVSEVFVEAIIAQYRSNIIPLQALTPAFSPQYSFMSSPSVGSLQMHNAMSSTSVPVSSVGSHGALSADHSPEEQHTN